MHAGTGAILTSLTVPHGPIEQPSRLRVILLIISCLTDRGMQILVKDKMQMLQPESQNNWKSLFHGYSMDVKQQLWIRELSKIVNFHAMKIQWALHVGKYLYRCSCDSDGSFHFVALCQCPYLKISITGNLIKIKPLKTNYLLLSAFQLDNFN